MNISPAKHPYVIAVGAVEIKNGRITRAVNATGVDYSGQYFTSRTGKDVEIAAPGHVIYGPYSKYTDSNGETQYYRRMTGTSQAAPFVTGALAILRQQFPTPSSVGATTLEEWNNKLREYLRKQALPMGGEDNPDSQNIYGDYEYGAGLVQAVPYEYNDKTKKIHVFDPLFREHARPDDDGYTGVRHETRTLRYVQTWNDWFKVDMNSNYSDISSNPDYKWIKPVEGRYELGDSIKVKTTRDENAWYDKNSNYFGMVPKSMGHTSQYINDNGYTMFWFEDAWIQIWDSNSSNVLWIYPEGAVVQEHYTEPYQYISSREMFWSPDSRKTQGKNNSSGYYTPYSKAYGYANGQYVPYLQVQFPEGWGWVRE